MSVEIGVKQNLEITEIDSDGIHLGDVLLPAKETEEELSVGEMLEVFVYTAAKGELLASLSEPFGQVGELAYLKVTALTSFGAFLEWGIEKDLFLPMGEQTCDVKEESHYLVKIYLDRTNRLCATMRVDDYLQAHPSYTPGEMVKGTVYGENERIGVFIAIEDCYYGFVPNAERYKTYGIGDQDEFRVIRIREDGRVDLSNKQVAHKQMDDDSEMILQEAIKQGGNLYLNDKSDPEMIMKRLNISKNAFKRAIGRLIKEKKIEQNDKGIRVLDENNTLD
ncbi:RNA binding S1 domain protein [Alkaliphilus metalliredigens QYMF]|uniref:RNA binding S1 domain protein n=1 Tax=Alkaliphilus metalliredigens (strain QYMF) TaxID=293826 RepID=A6TML0_ALKMQ|nr:S1-like domain-containing RNA-binding protein [Alkaliphilus metalliredigens]ABR47428.1 RNA binding S1 domain protein [Alkaliphilus metalliredigens QYMF]